jgi:hypothetical protein
MINPNRLIDAIEIYSQRYSSNGDMCYPYVIGYISTLLEMACEDPKFAKRLEHQLFSIEQNIFNMQKTITEQDLIKEEA